MATMKTESKRNACNVRKNVRNAHLNKHAPSAQIITI